jgi:ATP-dependent protease HslVU (ClpYQ) peptidase subunit
MTTIIGVQYDDHCLLVADSQLTDGNGRLTHHRNMSKISKRGNFLVAGAGEAFPCDVAQHLWNPPTPTEKDLKDLYHFMIVKTVPSLRKSLQDNGFNFEDAKDGEDYRFQFLVAVNGTLFSIDDDLAVAMRSDGIYAVGSGAKYAIGALYAGADYMEAMRIAASNDAYTSGPYQKKVQYKK